ncbi:hypothetical protein [Streptomyces asiaticus]|uniref:hypothetical protein n=1 Tax=Streptomyces asiaticus TaxID=114695 RepID=UPI003D715B53
MVITFYGDMELLRHFHYAVTVVARRPEDAPELDPLQRAGVVHLLREGLDTIEFIEGEDGEAVEITDHVIGAHPAGALLKVVIDAPALEVAVEAVIAEILEHNDPLAEWTVDACEGQLRFDVGGEGPVAAQEPEGPAADPATLDTAHRYSKPNRAPTVETKGEKTGASMRALVPQLAGVSLATFGHLTAQDLDGQEVLDESFSVARKDAELAAGAMVYSIDLLIDELFEDIDTLGYSPSVAECQDGLLQLGGSPPQFAHRYTPLFARRLLVVAVMLTERLCRPDFGQLRCVAEELLLRLLLETTEATLDRCGLLGHGVRAALDAFRENVFEDLDHELLHNPAMDGIDQDPAVADLGIVPTGIEDWFTSFSPGRPLHPYAANRADDE